MNESVSTGHGRGSKGQGNIDCPENKFEKVFGEKKNLIYQNNQQLKVPKATPRIIRRKLKAKLLYGYYF